MRQLTKYFYLCAIGIDNPLKTSQREANGNRTFLLIGLPLRLSSTWTTIIEPYLLNTRKSTNLMFKAKLLYWEFLNMPCSLIKRFMFEGGCSAHSACTVAQIKNHDSQGQTISSKVISFLDTALISFSSFI